MTETLSLEADLSTATPAEIDEVLFPLWAARWAAAERAYETRRRIAHSLFPWAVDCAGRTLSYDPENYYGTSDGRTRLAEKLSAAEADRLRSLGEVDRLNVAIAPIDAEFDARGGWTRYVLVGGGHLHRQGCGTLRPTTAAFLLAESSGLTATEVVDRYDFTACTHCFPDAPVLTDAEKAARSGACTGTGKYVSPSNGANAYRPYGVCPDCGASGALTSRHLVRKHKAAK